MRPFPAALFLCFFTYFSLAAQDSIPEVKMPKVKPDFRFGLNIAQTVTGILHPSTELINVDPYLFTFRLGNDRVGWRSGFNFANRKTETNDQFQGKRTSSRRSMELRTGVERNFKVSTRFELYWGIDAILGVSKDKIVTDFGSGVATIDTRATKAGFGPVVGIVWHIHSRVSLSTECSVYGAYTWEKSKIRAFPDTSENKSTQSQFLPILPSSVFINYYF
jgi:hypothetical protein